MSIWDAMNMDAVREHERHERLHGWCRWKYRDIVSPLKMARWKVLDALAAKDRARHGGLRQQKGANVGYVAAKEHLGNVLAQALSDEACVLSAVYRGGHVWVRFTSGLELRVKLRKRQAMFSVHRWVYSGCECEWPSMWPQTLASRPWQFGHIVGPLEVVTEVLRFAALRPRAETALFEVGPPGSAQTSGPWGHKLHRRYDHPNAYADERGFGVAHRQPP